MTNILKAICNIYEHKSFDLKSEYVGRNRANGMGDALEKYIKDAFANTFDSEEIERMRTHENQFSWLGSQNNPPDIIIKNGDAIEVKKTQSANTSLALNSSYPKAKIYANSPMITAECKACEEWSEKDIIYCVGHTSDSHVKSLWLVYGSVYSANKATYERIKDAISVGIENISDVIFSQTKELGRVNQVDPLGITNLRIRGMWQIENPRKVFDYLHTANINNSFELVCLVPLDKYTEFSVASKTEIESIDNSSFTITNVKVKNPNNPAQLVDCKLIKFTII